MGQGGKDSVLIEGYPVKPVAGGIVMGVTDATGFRNPSKFQVVRIGELFVQDTTMRLTIIAVSLSATTHASIGKRGFFSADPLSIYEI